jgi:hypothetical protein
MKHLKELMYKAVSVVAAASGRDRGVLELEFLDDHAAFYRKYEEYLRALPEEDKNALRGGLH